MITLIKFGDDRLRGLGSSKGQISVFHTNFDGLWNESSTRRISAMASLVTEQADS